MLDRHAVRSAGGSHGAGRSTVPPRRAVHAAGAVLAAGAAALAGLVLATAEGAPPSADRPSVHLVTVVTPIHGQAHRSSASRTGGRGGSTSGGSAQLLGSAARQAQVRGSQGSAASSPAASTSTAAGGLGGGSGTSPAAGATTETLRTAVTPVTRLTPATGGSTPARRAAVPHGGATAGAGSATPRLPDVLVIPPAALPAPSLIHPATTGFAAGPLAALLIGVVMLGALLGLRLARRRPT